MIRNILLFSSTHRRLTRVAILLCLCLFGLHFTFAQAPTFRGSAADFRHADLEASFQAYDIFELEIADLARAIAKKDQYHFTLELGDRFSWNLNLTYNDLRSSNYQEIAITQSGFQVLPKRRAITYEGFHNTSQHLEEVRLSIDKKFIMGFVTQDHQRYFIEPLSYALEGAPANYIIVYKPQDVIMDGPMECGVRTVKLHQLPKEKEEHHHEENTGNRMMACKEVQFLTAATFDMVNLWGSVVAVNDRIQTITNIMEPFYAFADIDYVIVQQFAPASNGADPFTASIVAGDLLNSIESWAGGGGISTHDIGQLWVNRDIVGCNGSDPDTNTSLIGCANIGVVCNSNRYNVCEDINSLSCNAILSAHELGHNWNAEHDDADGDDTNIMFPSLDCGNPPTQFGGTEQSVILAHKNSRGCLSDCGTPSNDECGSAITLGCGDNDSSTTDEATATGSIPICSGGGLPNAGVWYRFVGTGDIVTVSLAGSAFDTQLNIYTGSCGSLTCVAGDDDSGPGTTSEITFCSVNGTVYRIYIDGFGGTTGTYLITISCAADTQDPTINCPSGFTQNTDPGMCGADVTFTPATASDFCGIDELKARFRTVDAGNNPTSSYSSFVFNPDGFYALGRYQLQWRAWDPSGNKKSCSLFFEIVDNEPPMPVCLDPVVDFNGADEIFLMVDEVVDLDASSDNCGDVFFVSMNPTSVTCDELGDVIPVTVTVEDENGVQANCVANVTVDGLPCGWSADPDGINCPGGNSADYDVPTETFTVTSEGCYNPAHYRPTDSHGFATTELCGDGELIAEVTNVAGVGWAGIAMREGTGPSEKMIQLMIDGSFLTRREVRMSTNGIAFGHVFQTLGKNWLRLTRTGNIFGAYHSTDGITWHAILITMIPMSNCLDIGLITMNGAPAGQVTGTFENVTVNGVAPLLGIDSPFETSVENKHSDLIGLFPNPAIDVINVDLASLIGQEVNISIFNNLGQIVEAVQIDEVQNGVKKIDIPDFIPGTYLMSIQTETERIVKKFIVGSKRR